MKNLIIGLICFLMLTLFSIPFVLLSLITGFSLILSWVLFRKFPNFNI